MRREQRLRENKDFRRVFQRGKSTATPRFVLYWLSNREASFRVGFSVSKKVGNAVVRNRLKRVLREVFHGVQASLENHAVDFVVICRKGSADVTFQEVQDDVTKLLRKAKFMV